MRLTFRHITLLALLMVALNSFSQQIELDRQLFGSGYAEYDNGANFTMSASMGEVMIQTGATSNLIITQGFQQSNYVLSEPLVADMGSDSAACIGANDGSASVVFVSERLTTPLTYSWSNGATTETATQLEVGTYTVTITGANGLSVTNSVRVSPRDSVNCAPHFYTGITPNNDGDNDVWWIENADFFSTRELSIFNRNGSRVWSTDNYDNVADPFNGQFENGSPLPDGTYYYIANFDNSTYRGYIEISR
ncbi:MAG: gliding motility-associated C-terminal domain-containing protein [Flavobacteriales bacterium]